MPAHSVVGALPEEKGHEAVAGAVGKDFTEGWGGHCVGKGGRQIWCELLGDTSI